MQDGLGTGGEKLHTKEEKARKRAEEAMWVEVRRIFKEGGRKSAMQDLLKSGKETKAAQASRASEITMPWLPIAFYSVPGNFHHGVAFPLLGSLS
jgi:hypothetical protein